MNKIEEIRVKKEIKIRHIDCRYLPTASIFSVLQIKK